MNKKTAFLLSYIWMMVAGLVALAPPVTVQWFDVSAHADAATGWGAGFAAEAAFYFYHYLLAGLIAFAGVFLNTVCVLRLRWEERF